MKELRGQKVINNYKKYQYLAINKSALYFLTKPQKMSMQSVASERHIFGNPYFVCAGNKSSRRTSDEYIRPPARQPDRPEGRKEGRKGGRKEGRKGGRKEGKKHSRHAECDSEVTFVTSGFSVFSASPFGARVLH
jgi:hypothetical protein